MDIQYLKSLQANPELHKGKPIRGLSEEKITALETKFNNGDVFPKAFREYLFLAGEWGGTGVVYNDWDELRSDCDADLKHWSNTIDRPFFVFDRLDSQYSIFFLDEDSEDPECHILNASWDEQDSEPLLKKMYTGTFSGLIQEAVNRIKNDVSF